MQEGYERRMKLTKELNLEQWRQARFVAYTAAQPYLTDRSLSVWDFYPLEGDPAPEDIVAMKQAEIDRLAAEAAAARNAWLRAKYGEHVNTN